MELSCITKLKAAEILYCSCTAAVVAKSIGCTPEAGGWRANTNSSSPMHVAMAAPAIRQEPSATANAQPTCWRCSITWGIQSCRALGLSMGGNILLHMATQQPERIEAMVLVSATMYFPGQARKIMQQVPAAAEWSPEEWEAMRKRHKLGDDQILALSEWQRGMKDSYDDMNFTPPLLSRITARTLIVFGDRDPLYPVEIAVAMYRAIPKSALWIVPNGGHGPVFFEAAPQFVQTTLSFLRASDERPASG